MKADSPHQLSPLVKQTEVACAPERAFELFTAEISSWWPLGSHSMFEGETECVTMEPRVGGRVFERARDGRECDWGTVIEWAPPARVCFTWRVGKAADSKQEVEVCFEPSSRGTRVTLTHSGFAVSEQRMNYDRGWDFVLGKLTSHAGALARQDV